MTPPTPEWRRNRGDAVLDAEALEWTRYKIETTTSTPWEGKKERWYKAVQSTHQKVWRMRE